MRAASVLCALFVASIAFGEIRSVHIDPPGPTTGTAIDAHVILQCTAVEQSVTRNGPEITLTLGVACPRTSAVPPFAVETIRLPERLPPGEYRLIVTDGNDQTSTRFVVRNAGSKPFDIHPHAVPAFGGGLRLRIDGVACDREDCSDVTVRIDGAPAGPLTRGADGAIWLTAPIREEGLADVTVVKDDLEAISPAALYFFEAPEPSVFEPVLFPVLQTLDGAFGSKWVSEAVLSNPNPWPVENANTVRVPAMHTCLVYPCGERMFPGERTRAGIGFSRGAVLRVPRAEAERLSFALRIRDTSRSSDGLGTRVPVVREKDLFHRTAVPLLDVPIDSRYRVKVRIYSTDPSIESLYGTNPYGIVAIGETPTRSLRYDFSRRCATCSDDPYYAEVDLPAGAAHERVNLSVVPPSLDVNIWAFATVTNNETQQVTIITP